MERSSYPIIMLPFFTLAPSHVDPFFRRSLRLVLHGDPFPPVRRCAWDTPSPDGMGFDPPTNKLTLWSDLSVPLPPHQLFWVLTSVFRVSLFISGWIWRARFQWAPPSVQP
ncbi:hypothetical protein RR46_02763 [Papilio xuthus]|uniref:Uncharacterized protein n=1 Tax=Papilio xuthus TaxID=66420 RepID=A0A194Q5U4_PAPXU|nr:hypothetical protein RR46_02763 [Papilio xuthus]